MSWVVLVRPVARTDLAKARDWYEERSEGLGSEFLDEFAASARLLEADPEREQIYYDKFRRVILRRFPYKVFYQIIRKRVIIFRVLHARRDHPRRLRSR